MTVGFREKEKEQVKKVVRCINFNIVQILKVNIILLKEHPV